MASPYTIHVPDEKIEELQRKLSNATFPDELDDAGWDLGTPLADVKRLTKAWETFDWRKTEAKLNELPNFHQPISVPGFDALDIHYLHQKSSNNDAIPFLFCHGWPGNYLEASKILPELIKSEAGVSFHVVAPSLPNFGWSQGPKKRGFAIKQYAQTCHQLMLSLGYKHYVTQAGDWGWAVTRAIGILYPEACAASHLNGYICSAPTFTKHPLLALQHAVTPYRQVDKDGLKRTAWFREEGCGYDLQQTTKPQTIGYALQDSPVALLAWIYEKLHDWADEYPWTDDEILTWISIYYFSTAGPAAAERIYYEVEHADPKTGITSLQMASYVPKVKLGLMRSPHELEVWPWTWARTLGPVVFESEKTHGGHFAAWEHPEEVVSDLRKMFGKGGPCYRILQP